jgi:hypothetical protein
MSERLFDRIPFAKIVTVLAIVFGISLGLCGATAFLSNVVDGGGRGIMNFLIGFGVLEMIAIVLSAVGLVMTLIVFVTLLIFRGFSKKVSQPQKFFEDEDDTKNE